MAQIRITNTRTGRTTRARDGKDAAHMTKIELDRRSGMTVKQMIEGKAQTAERALAGEREGP